MKNITILICILFITVSEVYAVGLNSKAMALRTSRLKLEQIINLKELPIGIDVGNNIM